MARPRGEIKVVCQNEKCRFYLKESGKDIVKRGKYHTGHQRYFCNHCKTFFMETKGTPLYHKHLTRSEIIEICKHLVEKNGIRSIERITGHHRDTIGQLLEDLALHAEMVNSILLQEVKLGKFEVDEMWTFIKKKQKKVEQGSPRSNEEGDAWIYACIKRDPYLFVAYSVGKWTQKTCGEMIDKLFVSTELPSPTNKIKVFSDGNDDYTYVFPEYYPETCIDYGQLVKIRDRGKVIGKIKRKVFGNPAIDYIETTNIENFCGILRERMGRLVRKTKCYSKKLLRLWCATEIVQFYWNFMDMLPKNGTPAMIENLTNHPLTWDEFFNFQLSISN